MKITLTIIMLALAVFLAGGPVHAQAPAQSPAGSPQTDVAPDQPAALIDYREELRKFVQSISKFARSYNPNFAVLANGGLDLMVKRDPIDQTKIAPARAYMRAIDGVIQEGMFFDVSRGDKPFGAPTNPARQKALLQMAAFAQRNGLKVFAMDFGTGKAVVDAARKAALKRRFVSLVVDTPSTDIHSLPAYPLRPFAENPDNILSLDMVRNFAVIRNSAPFGHEDQFALDMHETNYDMMAVEVFHGRQPLSKRAVETLKYKKIGSRRLVLAYMNIGSAASYHYYWQPEWREGSPSWISAPHPDDPDRYNVEYWRDEWKQIIAGDTNSYTYGLIAQGFDGVIIDGLEAYKFFEGDTAGAELVQ